MFGINIANYMEGFLGGSLKMRLLLAASEHEESPGAQLCSALPVMLGSGERLGAVARPG